MLFLTLPFPTPYAPTFPELEVRNPHPKLQSLLSQEQVKPNLAGAFTGSIEQKPIKNLGEKGAYPGTAQIFGYPLLSQEFVKLRTSNFVHTFIESIGTKAREKFWKK